MSGTDPKNKWFRKGEPTEAFKPDGADAGGQPEIPSEQLEGLPKLPYVTYIPYNFVWTDHMSHSKFRVPRIFRKTTT